MTVLRATLKHARQRAWLTGDPCQDIESIYTCDRSEVIWRADEIDTLCAAMQPAMARAVRFLWLTGLRRGDAVRARWSDIQDGALVIRTAKTKRPQVFEVEAELAALLEATPRRAVTILTNAEGRPYAPDSLTQGMLRALKRVRSRDGAGAFAAGKRLHDMRGSRATERVAAVLADPEMRRANGWTGGRSDAPARYVSPVTALALARAKGQKNGA